MNPVGKIVREKDSHLQRRRLARTRESNSERVSGELQTVPQILKDPVIPSRERTPQDPPSTEGVERETRLVEPKNQREIAGSHIRRNLIKFARSPAIKQIGRVGRRNISMTDCNGNS